jgi:hypothetical protein
MAAHCRCSSTRARGRLYIDTTSPGTAIPSGVTTPAPTQADRRTPPGAALDRHRSGVAKSAITTK